MSNIEYKDLFIAEIDCEGRLRGLSSAHVETLTHSIKEYGQQTPILVRKNDSGQGFKLMAGAHRIKAMLSAERQMVNCKIYSGLSETEARLIEIDENLIRHELNPLDRAVFLAERKAIYEEMYPESKNGGDRKTSSYKNQNEMFSFSKETAKKLGMSSRSIERAVRIATKISPELRRRLNEAGYIKEGELYNLTRYEPVMQEKIIDLVLSKISTTTNVKSAADRLEGNHSTPSNDTYKQYHKLMDVWSRTETKARDLFIEFLKGAPS